jgi:hypothetical protein
MVLLLKKQNRLLGAATMCTMFPIVVIKKRSFYPCLQQPGVFIRVDLWFILSATICPIPA